MVKSRISIFIAVITVLILVGCGGAAVTTMSTQTGQTKNEKNAVPKETIDQASFLKKYFYGKWYSNDGGLEICSTIDENQISGGTYRVVDVEQTDHPVLYYQEEIYGGGFTETRSIEYSQLWDIHSDVKAIIENDEYYFNISGEKLDTFLAEHAEDISREKQERVNRKNSSSSNSGESNTSSQISKTVINACVQDAEDKFDEWFISNYSPSYADLGLYNPRDVRTQVTENTVSVAFEMEIGMLAPSQPTFSVTASYTIENGKASLFSFDVR